MDVTVVFADAAKLGLMHLSQGTENPSRVADIKRALGDFSAMLRAGVDLPTRTNIPVEDTFSDGTLRRRSWFIVMDMGMEFVVDGENPDVPDGTFSFIAEVSDDHSAWLIHTLWNETES